MKINIHLGDSQQAMQSMKDNQYGLGIVDPPYGIGKKLTTGGKGNGWDNMITSNADKWDIKPNKKYFDELFRTSTNQIIWGGNYFNLPPCLMPICWDKVRPNQKNSSEWEYAWTSFDGRARLFSYCANGGFLKKGVNKSTHPTAKPIKLYKWLLKNYGYNKDGSKRTIFDGHGGSMSIVIACIDMGFDIDIWEIDEDYYSDAVKRIKRHLQQLDLTREPVEINYIQQRKD